VWKVARVLKNRFNGFEFFKSDFRGADRKPLKRFSDWEALEHRAKATVRMRTAKTSGAWLVARTARLTARGLYEIGAPDAWCGRDTRGPVFLISQGKVMSNI